MSPACPKPTPKVKGPPKPIRRSGKPLRATNATQGKRGKGIKRTGLKGVRKSPYAHPSIQKLFRQVRRRSEGWCENNCGKPGNAVHHLWYVETGVRGWRRLLVPLDGLAHLCWDCHARIHPHLAKQ